MLFKSGNPSPKTSGKTLGTCHCQEQMETPSLIPNWVLALPHAWAVPSAAQHCKAKPDPGAPSDSAVLHWQLPASDKPEHGAEGARGAMPERTRAESSSSTALFHEKEGSGCPSCF